MHFRFYYDITINYCIKIVRKIKWYDYNQELFSVNRGWTVGYDAE